MITVKFIGLNTMRANLGMLSMKFPAVVSRDYTKAVAEGCLDLYRENLSGPQRPSGLIDGLAPVELPVGRISGALLAGAAMRMINQFQSEVTNLTGYAGTIEFGDDIIAPRRPLGDAVERNANNAQAAMQVVMEWLVANAHN